eukprot:gene20348-24411_t
MVSDHLFTNVYFRGISGSGEQRFLESFPLHLGNPLCPLKNIRKFTNDNMFDLFSSLPDSIKLPLFQGITIMYQLNFCTAEMIRQMPSLTDLTFYHMGTPWPHMADTFRALSDVPSLKRLAINSWDHQGVHYTLVTQAFFDYLSTQSTLTSLRLGAFIHGAIKEFGLICKLTIPYFINIPATVTSLTLTLMVNLEDLGLLYDYLANSQTLQYFYIHSDRDVVPFDYSKLAASAQILLNPNVDTVIVDLSHSRCSKLLKTTIPNLRVGTAI